MTEQQQRKKQQVTTMFNKIAHSYDRLNHLLSFNIDKLWRKKVIRLVSKSLHNTILDVATGTADLAIGLNKTKASKICGVDISEKMLKIGQSKVKQKGLDDTIFLQKGDAENIPFSDNTFEAVTVAFGVRNFENLEKGIAEMYRVLKKNGQIFVLEFTMPKRFPVKQLYYFYFNKILPSIGAMVSKDKEAYTYLPQSVKQFPQNNDFLKKMKKIGFYDCKYKSLSFGVAAIYQGKK